MAEVQRRFGGGRETVWRRFERRLGGGSRDKIFCFGGSRVRFFRRRFERRCGEDLGKSAAKNVRELSEPLGERKSVKKGENSVTREKVQFGEKKNMVKREKM